MPNLLIVDDEVLVLASLARSLRRHFGHRMRVELCSDPAAGLQRALERPFDVVLSDLRMPGMDGMSFLSRFADIQPHCVRLMLTGTADFATAQRAVNEIGIFRYLTKPWLDGDLEDHLQAALDQAQWARQQREEAVAWAESQGRISPQEAERQRLEQLEPGLTRVEWDSEGAVVMPPLV